MKKHSARIREIEDRLRKLEDNHYDLDKRVVILAEQVEPRRSDFDPESPYELDLSELLLELSPYPN